MLLHEANVIILTPVDLLVIGHLLGIRDRSHCGWDYCLFMAETLESKLLMRTVCVALNGAPCVLLTMRPGNMGKYTCMVNEPGVARRAHASKSAYCWLRAIGSFFNDHGTTNIKKYGIVSPDGLFGILTKEDAWNDTSLTYINALALVTSTILSLTNGTTMEKGEKEEEEKEEETKLLRQQTEELVNNVIGDDDGDTAFISLCNEENKHN